MQFDRGYLSAYFVTDPARMDVAERQVLPTLLTRPTSSEMTHAQICRVPLACHSKPWE